MAASRLRGALDAGPVLLIAAIAAGCALLIAAFASSGARGERRPGDLPAEATGAAAGEPGVQGASPLLPDLAASIEEIEKRLQEIRGLPFRSRIATSLLSPDGVRAYVREALRKEYPGDDLAAEEAALKYFGFLSPDQALEPIFLDLLQEQVAGLYDPERKTLFVVPGPAFGTIPLTHELAHALADQHFDLAALRERVKDDDDRALALSGLIEGEASMVMALLSVQSALDPGQPPLAEGSEEDLYRAAYAGLASAPPFLREILLFPYISGTAWASEIMRDGGGFKALDLYFRGPPDSTEQILHPEKSIDPRDLPSRIDDTLLRYALPAEARTVKLNTLGEFGIRQLLGGPDRGGAVRASAGWDGDRYHLVRAGGGMCLAWVSVWDSEEDAREFREAVAAWLVRRGGAAAGAGAVGKGRAVVVAEGTGDPGGVTAAERAASLASRLPEGMEIR